MYPVKNVTGISSCLFDGSLVESDTKSDENPIIFLANAMEIPWHELVQNPCHVFEWKMEIEMELKQIKLDEWHGIVMEFGVDLDQTVVALWHEMTWNFHENPCHIFYREMLKLYVAS